ncbi:MAG TPA: hypothetical protein VNM90_14760, partial [Haliangium sp.]|nr:hypothetical protein [Haliangium sp.]
PAANEPAPAPAANPEPPGATPGTASGATEASEAETEQAPERSLRRTRRTNRRKPVRRHESAATQAATDEISVEELRARYRAVGAQVDRLERKRGSGAARPLRERYLAIPYFDAVRVESLRRDVYRKLADISRDARRALDR